MAVSAEYIAWLEERFAPLGPLSRKRLFGGVCFYIDDAMFAVVLADTLYFKSDAETAPLFDAEGCPPFQYKKRGGMTTVNAFRRCPDAALDDDDAMLHWAHVGLEAGRRAAAEKARKAAAKKRKAKA